MNAKGPPIYIIVHRVANGVFHVSYLFVHVGKEGASFRLSRDKGSNFAMHVAFTAGGDTSDAAEQLW